MKIFLSSKILDFFFPCSPLKLCPRHMPASDITMLGQKRKKKNKQKNRELWWGTQKGKVD